MQILSIVCSWFVFIGQGDYIVDYDKKQKHHPSTYGTWQVIGAHAVQEDSAEPYDSSPSVSPDIQEDMDDLRELDRILAEEDEPKQSTYDSDESLEALDSVIQDLKKKSKVTSPPPEEQEPRPSGLDVQYLLEQEDPVDLTELERKLFGTSVPDDDEPGERELTLDEIEYTYLENLEKQYQQQKHASESESNNLDEIRKLMDDWKEQDRGKNPGSDTQHAAEKHKDS